MRPARLLTTKAHPGFYTGGETAGENPGLFRARGSGGWKTPTGVQGKVPVGGRRDEVHQKLKQNV